MKKQSQEIKDLVDIESEMKRHIVSLGIGFISKMDKLSLIELETCKRTILCDWENEA